MRRTLVLLLTILVLAPGLPARSNHDWVEVKKLKPGAHVLILLWSGEKLSGRVYAVSETGLRLMPFQRWHAVTDDPQEVERATIRKIARLPEPKQHDEDQWVRTGTLAGFVVGTTAGGIYDLTHRGSNYYVFRGAFGGAAIGFFGTIVVLAGFGFAEAIPVIFHHNKLVYEDKGAGRVPSQRSN